MCGRFQSAYLTFAVGGLLGGGLVVLGGPTGPLWFGSGVMSVLSLLAGPVLWRADWPRP